MSAYPRHPPAHNILQSRALTRCGLRLKRGCARMHPDDSNNKDAKVWFFTLNAPHKGGIVNALPIKHRMCLRHWVGGSSCWCDEGYFCVHACSADTTLGIAGLHCTQYAAAPESELSWHNLKIMWQRLGNKIEAELFLTSGTVICTCTANTNNFDKHK